MDIKDIRDNFSKMSNEDLIFEVMVIRDRETLGDSLYVMLGELSNRLKYIDYCRKQLSDHFYTIAEELGAIPEMPYIIEEIHELQQRGKDEQRNN